VPRRAEPSACVACGGPEHRFGALPTAYVYLLGLYLGDGCVSEHRRGVYKLRIALDAAYPGIVAEAHEAVRAVMPANAVGRHERPSNDVEVYSYSKAWPCLFPQHAPGKKHLRSIELTCWQEDLAAQHPQLLLRGLIHSDGCRFMNTGTNWRHPRYSFSNASDDIRGIFCQACDLVGVRYTFAPRTVYVSRTRDVAILDRFIGPKS
jgi:hypothetical protein